MRKINNFLAFNKFKNFLNNRDIFIGAFAFYCSSEFIKIMRFFTIEYLKPLFKGDKATMKLFSFYDLFFDIGVYIVSVYIFFRILLIIEDI